MAAAVLGLAVPGMEVANAATVGNGSSTSSASPGQLLGPFSELWAFLTQNRWPDGKPRLTGRLSLSFSHGVLTLSAVDEESGQYATLSGATLDDLFLSFEAGLNDGTLPWRPSKYASKGSRK